MKVRITIDEEVYTLDLWPLDDGSYRYLIEGCEAKTGIAQPLEVMPGVYSVLEGTRSRLITVAEGANGAEAWASDERLLLTVSDPRDEISTAGHGKASGRLELRSLMPGKVIRVLVAVGANVSAGQGLVVVEAMKMQNELKAPRDGRVSAIAAADGATVLAGVTLVVLE